MKLKKKAASFFDSISQKESIKKYKTYVDNYNFGALSIISGIGFIGGLILLILSLSPFHVLRLTSSYGIITAIFGVIFFINMLLVKRHKWIAVYFYYTLVLVIMIQSIYMGTAAGRTTNATTFLLFLLLFPVFIIDQPWKLIAINIILSIAFCIIDVQYKIGELLSLDISNTVVVCCISILLIIVMVRRNLVNFRFLNEKKINITEKDHLINAIPVGVAIYEIRGKQAKQIFTNDEFYRLFCDTREARDKRVAGNFLTSIHPDDRKNLLGAIKRVIDGENYIVHICRSMKGDGTYLPVRFAASVAKREPDYIEVYATYSSMEEEIRSKQESEAKTAFLSRISHDIRTPINAIIGMTKLSLVENNIIKIKEYLNYIDHSSDFSLGLINDILDLSKIESGEFSLSRDVYDESEFIENLHSIVEPLMKQKNINFEFNINTDLPQIITDKLRFNQVFFNLLSNASKFTPEGGKIILCAEPIPPEKGLHGIRFTVSDNGNGMSPEYMKKMFIPFTQDSYTPNEQGTGLGLPIVKSLVDAMNGRISVKSEFKQGTKITVELFFDVPPNFSTSKKDLFENALLNGMRILMAEDNELNIIVLKHLLESKKCVVTVAHNGKDCVDAFSTSLENTFDAILMDVRMPVMNGIEATRVIRAMNRSDAINIPIIAVTADAFTDEKKKTLDAGMNEHLTKPVEPEVLFSTLLKYYIKS